MRIQLLCEIGSNWTRLLVVDSRQEELPLIIRKFDDTQTQLELLVEEQTSEEGGNGT